MPQRMSNVLLAVGGLVTVAGLLLVGVNLRRAASAGPRWKRRLVGAGLGLLTALGLGSCTGDGGMTGSTQAGQSQEADGLAATPQWRQIVATWKEADDTASGRRGDYPFDEAGKKKLLADIEKAADNIETLRAAGRLTDGEAALLRQDLAALSTGVQAKRPTEMRNATCYEPVALPLPARRSAAELLARLPLLEKMAAQGRVAPEVLEKTLPPIERELAVLRDEVALGALGDKERQDAESLRAKVDALLPKLRAAARGSGPKAVSAGDKALLESAEWRTVVATWQAAGPPAESGESTTAERKKLDEQMEAARQAMARLAKQGLLSESEVQLLGSDLDRLKEAIYRGPPTDSKVLCYDMAYLPPAWASMERLARQAPLVKKMVEEKKIHAAVLAKVLPAMEADLKVLSNRNEVETLAEDKRAEAARLRGEVEKALAALRELAGGQQ